MKKTFGLLFLFLMSGLLFAQQKTHKVQPQETVYGISRQYGVTQDDLVEANPFLKERVLQVGDELVIPGKSGAQGDGNIKTKQEGNINAVVTQVEDAQVYIPKEDTNFIYLEIKPKQTIYSLTKEYEISEEALKSLNPQLKDGLKAGDIIRIPKKSNRTNEEVIPEGMYKVKRGDTVYSLSKMFNVNSDEFYIANPDVQLNGLIVDTYIHIPQKGKNTGVIQDGFIEHKVKAGETIYSITKLYRVSFEDLLRFNPELSEGLRAGMILKIPLREGADIIKVDTKIKRVDDGKINIALILPFHLDNPSGSNVEKQISTDILIGAKVALDSLAYTGKKINLKVFDSSNGAQKVETMIAENDFSQFDAVVGPLFASNFKSTAIMLSGSGITVVSPISNSEDLSELENVLVVTASDKDVADAIVNEVAGEYKGEQILVLTDTRNLELAEYFVDNLKRKASTANINLIQDINQLRQQSTTVDERLSDGTVVEKQLFAPLVTVLVSDNNSLGNQYVDKIKEMDAENLKAYGVKFVNAYDVYSEKNKSNIAVLKNIGFTFATNRLVNVYGKNERITLQKFLDLYCEIPNEYRQLGFDVFYDLVDRMNTRGDVLNNLSSEKTRLSTKFKYEKRGKAHVNTGVRVIRLFTPLDESPDEVE